MTDLSAAPPSCGILLIRIHSGPSCSLSTALPQDASWRPFRESPRSHRMRSRGSLLHPGGVGGLEGGEQGQECLEGGWRSWGHNSNGLAAAVGPAACYTAPPAPKAPLPLFTPSRPPTPPG
jgi:hypothetical protein